MSVIEGAVEQYKRRLAFTPDASFLMFSKLKFITTAQTSVCLIVLYYDEASQKESITTQTLQSLRNDQETSGLAQ